MDKERKIAFYTLVKDMWGNNADGLEGLIPFYEIKEVGCPVRCTKFSSLS